MRTYRELFPAVRHHVYLNNAGVAPPSRRVGEAISRWVEDLTNHGLYHEGMWEEMADSVRARCAALIGASPGEITFVRNTSHGLGLFAEGLDWREGDEVAVSTQLEYPSNVYPWLHLATRGVKVREIEPVDGGVTPEAAARAIGPKTRVLAVSAVQYATGHRTDLEALGALARRHGVLLCVDAIQQIGVVPLDVKKAGVHFLSADSHKWMMGLPGVGFAYADASLLPHLRPSLVGWKSTTGAFNFDVARFELRQDAAKLEEGSPAYALIAGMGAAVDLLQEAGVDRIQTYVAGLLESASPALALRGCKLSPAPSQRAGILMVETPGDVMRAAAACAERAVRVSVRRGKLRVSPHLYNDEHDMRALVDALSAA